MPKIELTKLARIPLLILDYAASCQLDTKSLLKSASLDASAIQDPDSRVPLRAQIKLWRELNRQLEDDALGLRVGCSVSAAQLGIVGYTMAYSKTLGEAFIRLARYQRIISEAIFVDVINEGDNWRLQLNAHPSLMALGHPSDCQLAVILTVAREITGQDLAPVEVSLPATRSGDRRAYLDTFQCELRFGQPAAAIVFTARQIALPVVSADATLSGYLAELAGNRLDGLQDSDRHVVDSVRRRIWSDLASGKPDLAKTAAQLFISPRTLQRRLREQGTSYSRVVEDLRRDLSRELLVDGDLAVADVAFLLGYSEPSALQRAFKRWQGKSPTQFKREFVA